VRSISPVLLDVPGVYSVAQQGTCGDALENFYRCEKHLEIQLQQRPSYGGVPVDSWSSAARHDAPLALGGKLPTREAEPRMARVASQHSSGGAASSQCSSNGAQGGSSGADADRFCHELEDDEDASTSFLSKRFSPPGKGKIDGASPGPQAPAARRQWKQALNAEQVQSNCMFACIYIVRDDRERDREMFVGATFSGHLHRRVNSKCIPLFICRLSLVRLVRVSVVINLANLVVVLKKLSRLVRDSCRGAGKNHLQANA
jgi:hypothetical protein